MHCRCKGTLTLEVFSMLFRVTGFLRFAIENSFNSTPDSSVTNSCSSEFLICLVHFSRRMIINCARSSQSFLYCEDWIGLTLFISFFHSTFIRCYQIWLFYVAVFMMVTLLLGNLFLQWVGNNLNDFSAHQLFPYYPGAFCAVVLIPFV